MFLSGGYKGVHWLALFGYRCLFLVFCSLDCPLVFGSLQSVGCLVRFVCTELNCRRCMLFVFVLFDRWVPVSPQHRCLVVEACLLLAFGL